MNVCKELCPIHCGECKPHECDIIRTAMIKVNDGAVLGEVRAIVLKFRKWKKENPDEEYQYDEIHDFISGLKRGELLKLFEYLDKTIK